MKGPRSSNTIANEHTQSKNLDFQMHSPPKGTRTLETWLIPGQGWEERGIAYCAKMQRKCSMNEKVISKGLGNQCEEALIAQYGTI